jgi:hypothetical protein
VFPYLSAPILAPQPGALPPRAGPPCAGLFFVA